MPYVLIYVALMLVRAAKARAAYPVLLVALFLLSAFRFEVGCDWTGYLNQYFVFQSLSISDLLSTREPLWEGAFVLQHWLGLPYPWINVMSSAVFFAGVHRLARRQPDPLGFLILMFPILIVNMPMSAIRQSSAIGVMCVAFNAFNDRRLARYVAFTAIASALHSSAMVFLLLAPLVNGRYSRSRLVYSALLALPGALLLTRTGAAETATSRYIDTSIEAAGALSRVGLLALTGLVFLTALRSKWQTAFPRDFKLALLGSMLMILSLSLLAVSSVLGDRLGYYLIPIQTMILARLRYLPIGKNRASFVAAPYIASALVFAAWTYFSTLFSLCYVPYNSWLFGMPASRYGLLF